MKKYQVCVSDEVATKFDALVTHNKTTAYGLISLMIHTQLDIPYTPRSEKKKTKKSK